jgi:NAD(P)-dependent dehydrogenase (short-subunit alcohol dehydrogenase family)
MAQALAEVGVRGVAILDVQQELGDNAARELSEQTGVDVRFYRVDVRDGLGITQTVQDIIDHYGALDVLINAAGIAECVRPDTTQREARLTTCCAVRTSRPRPTHTTSSAA